MIPTQKNSSNSQTKKLAKYFLYIGTPPTRRDFHSRYITFEKEKPETNKKTVATLHETQDKNKQPPQTLGSLQGQSAPQNLMRERKKHLFH